MHTFFSIKELINTLAWAKDLLSEMFEKRKALSYKYEYALEFMDMQEEKLESLISRGILLRNGPYLEIEDQYLQFFEQILEVNEEINTAYIHEHIQQLKENINYYLQENNESRQYTYLKAVKAGLRKIGRITIRNIVDLNRNIENTFKTEPNYKIKVQKLKNYDQKRQDISLLIRQTESLLTEEEKTFFTTALDEELKQIRQQLRLDLYEAGHNLIETQKQIIEFLNQIKHQSQLLEKLRQVKYLKDQFELKSKTNIAALLAQDNALLFEPKPAYPLKLSLDFLQKDAAFDSLLKVNRKKASGTKLKIPVADTIAADYLQTETEEEVYINLEEIKNGFFASGNHLFDFIMRYSYPKEVSFPEKVTLFCQLVSIYESELLITDGYKIQEEVEYAIIYPK